MWRKYAVKPFLDMDYPDTPGWKIFMIEGNAGWAFVEQVSNDLWIIQANLTAAQHEVYMQHPSVDEVLDE